MLHTNEATLTQDAITHVNAVMLHFFIFHAPGMGSFGLLAHDFTFSLENTVYSSSTGINRKSVQEGTILGWKLGDLCWLCDWCSLFADCMEVFAYPLANIENFSALA